MKTLVISEKDIAAKRIATILSGGDFDASKVGGVNVYEFTRGKGKAKETVTIVGLRGHIISLDYPKQFTRWSLQKLPELVWVEPEKHVDKSAKNIGDALKKLSKKADLVVIATDYDREGELIGVEALDLVLAQNKEVEVKRARFSALTKDEVTRAFENLTEVDHNLASSAEARQVVDLAWGATLTRFLSIASGQRGKDFLSVGRVQSPTLALIVDREKEIRAFVPKPYWELTATLRKGTSFDAMHENGRFWDQAQVHDVHARVASADTGTVTSVDRSKRTVKPPTPFDTTDYQRAAAALGYTIKRADSIAEGLYTSGYISYPRTANKVYPKSLDLREILEKFAAPNSPFREDAQKLLERETLTPTRGKKETTDHPPIHPVEVAKATDLSGPEWRVYELVVRRFFATLSDAAVTERLKITIDIKGEAFNANGQRLIEPGFLAVYPYSSRKDVILPAMDEGEKLEVRSVDVHSKETQPPSRLTQARLVQEMETLGLGTKATRGDIIQKLYDRDYVRNKTPEPTETGFAMVDALERYATLIAKPDMTSKLEAEMDRIADGGLQFGEVVKDSRDMLSSVLDDLEKNREAIGQEIRKALQVKNTIGICDKSKHPLIIRRSRAGKRFVGCSGWPDCDVTWPLPQYGKIIADETQCPICSAPVIRVGQAKGRMWVTCLTIECKGAEEREREEREAKKAARENAQADDNEDGEDDQVQGEPDPEDLGLEEEET